MTINETTQLLSKGASVKLLADMLKQAEEDKRDLLEALKGFITSPDGHAIQCSGGHGGTPTEPEVPPTARCTAARAAIKHAEEAN